MLIAENDLTARQKNHLLLLTMIKNIILLFLLILNPSLGFCQNMDNLKFQPEYELNIEDSLNKQLNGYRYPDSLSFFGIDDTEFCIQFPGGDAALLKYLKKSIVISKDSIYAKIEGKIFISFTVNEKGKVENIVIERGLDKSLDKIIIKAISEMPDWIWNCKEKPNRNIITKRYLPISIKQNKEKMPR